MPCSQRQNRRFAPFTPSAFGTYRQQDDARLLLPRSGEHFSGSRSESIRQALNPAAGTVRFVRGLFTTGHPDNDGVSRERELAREQCGVIADTTAIGRVLAGDEMPGHALTEAICC